VFLDVVEEGTAWMMNWRQRMGLNVPSLEQPSIVRHCDGGFLLTHAAFDEIERGLLQRFVVGKYPKMVVELLLYSSAYNTFSRSLSR
jgi:hypothetical protein